MTTGDAALAVSLFSWVLDLSEVPRSLLQHFLFTFLAPSIWNPLPE